MSANLAETPLWRAAGDIYTFGDAERHLGHIIHVGDWHAFDGIHVNETGDGFKGLGTFASAYLAKVAVEWSVLGPRSNLPVV